MYISLNGEKKLLESQISVAGLVENLGLDTRKIAVEVNLEIIPKSTYPEKTIKEGDNVEIVHFIAGG